MKAIVKALLRLTPLTRAWFETRETQTPIPASIWLAQKLLGINRTAYWPVHPSSQVQHARRIRIGIETSPGLMRGCYIQGTGGISIGDYTQIAPNVGIISSNHDLHDNRASRPKPVRIGAYCWLGMGSIVLPGVELGDFTVVGAGAVVTKSFRDGYCVIAGNPARKIKVLDPIACVRHKSLHEYHGFVRHANFSDFGREFLEDGYR